MYSLAYIQPHPLVPSGATWLKRGRDAQSDISRLISISAFLRT